jgi:hypothetical protein
MKNNFRTGEKRSELSALMAVISLLMVGTLAKVSAATQLFHLVHWNASGWVLLRGHFL